MRYVGYPQHGWMRGLSVLFVLVGIFVSCTTAPPKSLPTPTPSISFTVLSVQGRPSAIAARGESLWVAEDVGGTVARLDAGTGRSTWRIKVCAFPAALELNAGVLWVVCSTSNAVVRLDAATGRLLARIPTGRDPVDVTLGYGSAWVANLQDKTVTRIDAATGRVLTRAIHVAGGVVRVSAGNGAVWVTGEQNTLRRIDPSSGAVTGEPIIVGDAPLGVDASGPLVWVAVEDGHDVVGVDPTQNALKAEYPVSISPADLALAGRYLWVTDALAQSISRVDVSNGVVQTAAINATPTAIVWSGSTVWVGCVDPDEVLRVS